MFTGGGRTATRGAIQEFGVQLARFQVGVAHRVHRLPRTKKQSASAQGSLALYMCIHKNMYRLKMGKKTLNLALHAPNIHIYMHA